MSNASQIAKTTALTLLNLGAIADLNDALLQMADSQLSAGLEPSDELQNPEAYDSISRETLVALRDYLKQVGQAQVKALPSGINSSDQAQSLSESAPIATTTETQAELTTQTVYSDQVLVGALATIQQLYRESSILEALDLADMFWDMFDETFAARSEQRLEQTINALSTRMEETFNRFQQRQNIRNDAQTAQLGKLNKASKDALKKASEMVKKAQSSAF